MPPVVSHPSTHAQSCGWLGKRCRGACVGVPAGLVAQHLLHIIGWICVVGVLSRMLGWQKHGVQFEAKVRKQEKANPKFAFLLPWHPYHSHYRCSSPAQSAACLLLRNATGYQCAHVGQTSGEAVRAHGPFQHPWWRNTAPADSSRASSGPCFMSATPLI